jgi:cobalt/nickel transport system ATP-binding protein
VLAGGYDVRHLENVTPATGAGFRAAGTIAAMLEPRREQGATGAASSAAAAAPVAELREVAKHYGEVSALAGLSLGFAPGRLTAVLGPNGAGKTTLVLHLNGVHRTQAGRVEVGGLPVAREHLLEIRRRVGIVFQDPDDQLFMPTVRDDVAFGPANLGIEGDELDRRVIEALEAVGMRDHVDRAPHHLSFGQRRRVAVATVLAMRPEILVLDEPSSNLDPAGRRELADILRALPITLLIVTHDLPYALELCPRSLVMNDGRIVADGPTFEILSDEPLMTANRLELPFGFVPSSVAGRVRHGLASR